MVFLVVLCLGAFLGGLIVGRWWAIAAAIPVAVWLAYETPFENSVSGPPYLAWGAVVLGGLSLFIALGVSARFAVRVLGGRSHWR
jgi:hypothetical protein